ncbi:MAG: glycosyltransferase family 39 protein [Oscillospiraceae bacterium]|nr:glycosyltransferase family 39 protein [Oscillospiraceae bacterium]
MVFLKKMQKATAKHAGTLAIAALAVGVFVMLAYLASVDTLNTFWNDEVCDLEIASGKLLHIFTSGTDGNYLYAFLLWIWYHITPYGDAYLLLFPQFFCALSIFATGMAVKSVTDSRSGVAASVFLIVSLFFIQYANELRPYMTFVCYSALLIWCYATQFKRKIPSIGSLICFGILLYLMVSIHMESAALLIFVFFADVILIIKKKRPKRVLLSYVGAVLLFIPWYLQFTKAYFRMDGNVPINSGSTFPKLINLFSQLPSLFNPIVYFLLLLAIAYTVYAFFKTRNKAAESAAETAAKDSQTGLVSMIFVIASLGCVLGFYVVSRYFVAKYGAGTFWINRYFLFLFPFFAFIFGFFVHSILKHSKSKQINTVFAVAMIAALLLFVPANYVSLSAAPSSTLKNGSNFPRAADWIYSQGDVMNEDVAVCFNHPHPSGIERYFAEQKGTRSAWNYLNGFATENLGDKYKKVYFVQNATYRDYGLLNQLNEEYYLVEEIEELSISVYILRETY